MHDFFLHEIVLQMTKFLKKQNNNKSPCFVKKNSVRFNMDVTQATHLLDNLLLHCHTF